MRASVAFVPVGFLLIGPHANTSTCFFSDNHCSYVRCSTGISLISRTSILSQLALAQVTQNKFSKHNTEEEGNLSWKTSYRRFRPLFRHLNLRNKIYTERELFCQWQVDDCEQRRPHVACAWLLYWCKALWVIGLRETRACPDCPLTSFCVTLFPDWHKTAIRLQPETREKTWICYN